VRRIDRAIGVALALLAAVVLWTSRSFPAVPGQKVGAGFLPAIVGAGLLVCGIGLVLRSARSSGAAGDGGGSGEATGPVGPALVVLGGVLGYILLADRLGFLIVAPLVLMTAFRALGISWRASVPWALAGTLVVHVAFYKLLRVPLPWGVLRPFY
jgi:putative tricarboxylic transport membrane protein